MIVDRLLTISKILQLSGPIKGEKTIQKLVYLIQSHCENLGYSFNWNKYGPVSKTLDRDLLEAEMLKLIKISWDDKIPIYDLPASVGVSEFWRKKSDAFALSPNLCSEINRLSAILGKNMRDPRMMEVLASVDYLKKNDETKLNSYREEYCKDDYSTASDLLSQLIH